MRYLFEEYAFDTDRRELHRGTDAVSITPQVFDLLEYLIRKRERVVSKDDLMCAPSARKAALVVSPMFDFFAPSTQTLLIMFCGRQGAP